MEFFNSYQTEFPSGPFFSCLSWLSGAETILLPSQEPPMVCTACWPFLWEETSIPHKPVLWLTWSSWRSLSLFICRTKIHAKLGQRVCFILISKFLVVEEMHGRRAVKGTVVEKWNRDRELTKDSDRTHTKLEADPGDPLTVSVEVSTERWRPTGNLRNEFLFSDGNCFSAHHGADKAH